MKPVRSLTCFAVLACMAWLLPSIVVAQTIVWTDSNARTIQAKGVNGGTVQTIVQFDAQHSATWIEYDPVAREFYYLLSTSGTTKFQRCKLDGSGPEDIVTSNWGYFALNIELRKLYWGSLPANLHRSEFDGSGEETRTFSPACCVGPMLAIKDKFFFATTVSLPKGIWVANPDMSGEQFIHGTASPVDLDFDPIDNKIYIATGDGIYRMNPDGTQFEGIAVNALVDHLAVDTKARKLYWADLTNKVIRRSNLDGSNVEIFLDANQAGNPNLNLRGLTIVDSPSIPTLSELGIAIEVVGIVLAGAFLAKARTAVKVKK